MVKCELRTINESGHKLIEFLSINSQVIVTLEFHIVLAGEIEGVDSSCYYSKEGMLVLSSTDSCQMPLSAQSPVTVQVQLSLDMSRTIMSASQVQLRQRQRKRSHIQQKREAVSTSGVEESNNMPRWERQGMLPRKTAF